MQIQIFSDLHLEFSDKHPPFQPPHTGADVVVLAGDIDNGTRGIDWAEKSFPGAAVLYVPGNHEYYGADLNATEVALTARAADSANVRLLDNDQMVIDGVRFLGSTLWTDFELFGRQNRQPAIEESLRHVLDFRAIRWGTIDLFTPEQSIELHRESIAFLQENL
ncbi:MAG TPA: metallophosphoesterase, partial [Burkholderiales bacterium]|nr:metallophosphoesterase [Burkholderiales bacterium]